MRQRETTQGLPDDSDATDAAVDDTWSRTVESDADRWPIHGRREMPTKGSLASAAAGRERERPVENRSVHRWLLKPMQKNVSHALPATQPHVRRNVT